MARLQWSKPAAVVAPNRFWVVEVNPILDADENRTPVSLRNCRNSKVRPLFILARDAELHWSADSKNLLVINEYLSGTSEVLLFSAHDVVTGAPRPPDAINMVVMAALEERLGKARQVDFYLPAFVSWNDSSLVLAIGGMTNTQVPGPMKTYCYGMTINTSTLRIDEILSEEQLKSRSGDRCQSSP